MGYDVWTIPQLTRFEIKDIVDSWIVAHDNDVYFVDERDVKAEENTYFEAKRRWHEKVAAGEVSNIPVP